MAAGESGDKYTADTYQVIALAKQSVMKYHHSHITPEHMLMGLLEVNSASIQRVLDASKATADQIRVLMKAHLRDGDVHISEDQVKFSERAKRVVEAAKQEAFRGQNQVAPEHLLLGLTRVTNTVCSAVLRAVNITDESIRATLGITPK